MPGAEMTEPTPDIESGSSPEPARDDAAALSAPKSASDLYRAPEPAPQPSLGPDIAVDAAVDPSAQPEPEAASTATNTESDETLVTAFGEDPLLESWAKKVGLNFERPQERKKGGRPKSSTGWNERLTPIMSFPNRWVKMELDTVKGAERASAALRKKQEDLAIVTRHDPGESFWEFAAQRDHNAGKSYLYVLYHVPAELHDRVSERCGENNCTLIPEAEPVSA